MTIESLLETLTYDEKLAAFDLLWRDLAAEPAHFPSPDWHGRTLAQRLANPAPGPALPLDQAKAEVIEAINARKTTD